MTQWNVSSNEETFDRLIAAYSEKHRHYHTVVHISHCLYELESVRSGLDYPNEVELALWFHDAIYQPYSSDNERKSADWAGQFLRDNGCAESSIDRVDALIMATLHDATVADADTATLVDIDLSILGADATTYSEFERNVRKEYRWVPGLIYRRKRAEILQSFLDRPTIYATSPFQQRLEQQAQHNLLNAIKTLRSSSLLPRDR